MAAHRMFCSRQLISILFTCVVFLNLLSISYGRNVPSKEAHPGETEAKYYLAKDATCAQDVNNLCKKVKKENNFAVFVCLQDASQQDEDDVSEECHETLWHYKYNLTQDARFDEAAFKVCESTITALKEECKDLAHTPGFLVNCLIEHRHTVEDQRCRSFLTKMSAIIFEDYRLIKGFYDDCHNDVKKTSCAQLSKPSEQTGVLGHAQTEVVSCLEASIEEVSEKCQKQLFKIAELQADDYHLDRPLFYACQDARERFCHDIKSGEGRIYKCLMKHASEDLMPSECAAKLVAKEKLMQKDVKVNRPLWINCEEDFKKYKCEPCASCTSEHGAGSHMLMCLQQKIAEGETISPNCQAELRDFAVLIFENYQISPIILAKCDVEIHSKCSHLIGKRDDGDMMDCLMTIAAANNSLSDQCFSAVSEVLKETGAGNNYKVDRALYLACEPVISNICEGKEDAMMLGCLMDNAQSDKMPPECAAQVFHLQYFMSRDFRLDASLYHDCKDDAKKICHAADFTADKDSENNAGPHNFVIACLYRNSFQNKHVKNPVSAVCSDHVRRVMHHRATNIRLMPEIEQPCMADLGKHCLDISNQDGEEVDCLQTNLEVLSTDCQAAVRQFTELESKDFDLDKHLVDKCGKMVTKFCKAELKVGQGELILPCLVKNKNDIEMDHRCASAIEHWQLLEIKDFNFSPALKEHCLKDIRELCPKSQTKIEAVHCLSEHIVKNFKNVSEQCRMQVKNDLMEQSENIKLTPDLYEACQDDIDIWCSDVPSGGAQVEECLRKNQKKLRSAKCKDLLFKTEKVESQDVDLDYRLMHVCKPMIKKYCAQVSGGEVLSCLRQYTHDREMSIQCRDIIKQRQIEQSESFILDPELSNYCLADAQKYCDEQLKLSKTAGDNGHVFGCLVDTMMAKKVLSKDCDIFLRRREAEASLELKLNPMFLQQCRDEISKICPHVPEDMVIDCMKINIPKIKSKGCVQEVRKLIQEGVEDVHVDPHLEEQCARDIRTFCHDMPRKSGNVVLCLLDVHKAKNLHLQPNCENFLTKRLSLYNVAGLDLASFDSVSAVIGAVAASPNRNYIYMNILFILAILFFGGLMFGRITKRVRAEVKNR